MKSIQIILLFLFTILSFQLFAQDEVYAPPPQSTSFTPPQSTSTNEQYYIIKKWDTLWDLAGNFLEDPFRWPEIHQINAYIHDPHWIYPGNRILIPGLHGGYSHTSVAKPDFYALTAGFLDNTEAPSETGLEKESKEAQEAEDVGIPDDLMLREALLSDNFFSPEFLSKIGFLWHRKDLKGKYYPGNGTIIECNKGTVYRQFDEIAAQCYSAACYSLGDTIEIYHSDRMVKFKGSTANVIRVVAKGKVTFVDGVRIRAQLFRVWDIVECKDHIGPAQSIQTREFDELLTPQSPLEAKVFQRIENTESPYLYRCFLMDQGSIQGVNMGDLFAVYPVEKKVVSDRPSALACVVNTQESSSSLAIVKLFNSQIEPGDKTKLVKRIQFK